MEAPPGPVFTGQSRFSSYRELSSISTVPTVNKKRVHFPRDSFVHRLQSCRPMSSMPTSRLLRRKAQQMHNPHIHALAPEHILFIVEACTNWRELAQWGPPYWRPRSAAELQRKIADTSGPMPAGAYTFVIEDGGTLVGECSLHAID